MPEFAVCAGCDRHVRAEDSACPFCGSSSRRPTLRRRMALPLRTLLATGALGGAVVGCASEKAIYGGPAMQTSSSSTSTSGAGGQGMGGQSAGGDNMGGSGDVALYGAPPTTGSGGAGGGD